MRLYLQCAALLLALFCYNTAVAQTIINGENNGSRHEGCNFLWYDSGGSSGNIANNREGYGITFVSPESHLRLEFASFDIGGTMTTNGYLATIPALTFRSPSRFSDKTTTTSIQRPTD